MSKRFPMVAKSKMCEFHVTVCSGPPWWIFFSMSKSDLLLRSCGDLILLIGKVAVCYMLSSVSVVELLPLGCSDPLLWTGFVSAAAIGANTESFNVRLTKSAELEESVTCSLEGLAVFSSMVQHVPSTPLPGTFKARVVSSRVAKMTRIKFANPFIVVVLLRERQKRFSVC